MIVPVKDILTEAKRGGYAVGAFNTINLEITRAILDAAHEQNAPVIIQVTEKTMEYAGGRAIIGLIRQLAEYYYPDVPLGIHLDHGKSFEVVSRAIEIGFPSVMYDGSRKEYADNVSTTKLVVELCRKHNVSVQAELGNVPYLGEVEAGSVDWDKYMTDPDQAVSFVKDTGVDSLAVAIGNAHGFVKEREEPDYNRLKEIYHRIDMPIVLHGASDWEEDRVKKVVQYGVACFNVDTSSRLAFVNALASSLCGNEGEVSYDVRKHLTHAREAVKEAVKHKIEIFGSVGKTHDFQKQ